MNSRRLMHPSQICGRIAHSRVLVPLAVSGSELAARGRGGGGGGGGGGGRGDDHKFHLGQSVHISRALRAFGRMRRDGEAPGMRWRIRISHPEYG